MDKVHIEKNTVQETLVIPLYARRLCGEQFPTLFRDEKAMEQMNRKRQFHMPKDTKARYADRMILDCHCLTMGRSMPCTLSRVCATVIHADLLSGGEAGLRGNHCASFSGLSAERS